MIKKKKSMSPLYRYLPALLLSIYLPLIAACSDDSASKKTIATPLTGKNYTETGDLRAIRKHGKLRIISLPSALSESEQWLPREGEAVNSELEMASELAAELGLKPVLIHVEHFKDLIPALLEGKGDIIINNLTATEARKSQLAFSVPLAHSTEHIISRKKNKPASLAALSHRIIAYQAGTSFEDSVLELQKKHPSIKSHPISDNLSEDEILDMLVKKQIDLGVLDSNRIEILKGYRNDFSKGPAISEKRAIAWAVRPESTKLLQAINQFLVEQKLTQKKQIISTADLAEIKKRKTLRVITRNNAANYFLWRGELLGFEYELARKFAEANDLRVEIITAPDHESQIPMLLEGQGDMIVGFLTITEQRKQQGITFSRPYHSAPEVIVSRSGKPLFTDLQQLRGRSIYARKSSAYWGTLESLKQQGIEFNMVAVDEDMETEEIIARVASGEYDLTIADQHMLDIELTWRDDIQAAFTLDEVRDHGWAVRKNNPQLLSAVNQFIRKNYRQLFFNITYNKYFKDEHKIRTFRDERLDIDSEGRFSPYDALVKKYAKQYQFDWRLLTAQMYQESRFDPSAKSWVGAKGLMQVMPRTAKELGISKLEKPENGIKAGVMYMDWVRDRFSAELDVKQRMWFTLAAYNAGQGHVKDARRLAAQLGMNPDQWFNNVEKAMLLLSKQKYYRKARHGYVRGSEPVNYVREIRDRYYAYLSLKHQGE